MKFRHTEVSQELSVSNDMQPQTSKPDPSKVVNVYLNADGVPFKKTDGYGNIIWQAEYDAQGKIKNERGSGAHQPFRLQGQYYDEETGLHYNGRRYYDPDIGRFITQDPIGLAGGTNPYQYAPNTTGWIDPLGLARICKRPLNAPVVRKFKTHMAQGRNPQELGAYHEQILFDDGTNIGYAAEKGIYEEKDEKLLMQYKCSSKHYDDERMRKAVKQTEKMMIEQVEKKKQFSNGNNIHKYRLVPKYHAQRYNILKNNCQHFVSDVLDKY
ncbi:RHS repeat domain-containing protein [Neisseria sp.]|uniref:RHS repeat domain-containing protein n=1 Tax=Neisseria sp. TaxID=192066 RepID=UPI0026DBE355|nr:RHS repeat-associated core domain-containing protein [Neisseria sp.]MDO4226859.1 RHS repeat-associated core domain-containing protein [Neisseria sp.]